MSLQGKNIIITGATSGFGVQMAATFSAEGATVFMGGRADTGLQVAHDTNSTFYVVDVADEASSQATMTRPNSTLEDQALSRPCPW
jgi:NADP-dependent 3-hydroxy acid dehydrogenase YdfG